MSSRIILSVTVYTANEINDSLGVLATGLGMAKYRLFKWKYDRRRGGNYNSSNCKLIPPPTPSDFFSVEVPSFFFPGWFVIA